MQIIRYLNRLRHRLSLTLPLSLIVIGLAAGTPQAQAQVSLTIVNPSFEVPGTGKIADFRDTSITGWDGVLNSGGADSGVENVAITGKMGDWVGFIQPKSDFTAFNFFDGYQAAGGETISLNFLAAPAAGDVDDLEVELFYDTYATANIIETQTISGISGTTELSSQSLDFTLPGTGSFVGENIGFALTNTDLGNDWVRLDDFSATSTVPEPSTAGLLAGVITLAFCQLRRRVARRG